MLVLERVGIAVPRLFIIYKNTNLGISPKGRRSPVTSRNVCRLGDRCSGH